MQSAIAVKPSPSVKSPYAWITGMLIGGLVAILYTDVLLDLANEWWTQSEASYGLLIPPFALYVAYLRRSESFAVPARPSLGGLTLLFLACFVFLTGKLASEFFLTRISFVVLLGGLIWTFWGRRRLRSFAFPLILMLTMVPPPAIIYNTAAAPLQLFASKIAADVAQLAGVSIYRDGNIIHLANTSLGVAEACSGLHSLSALIVASLLLGFLENGSILGRVAVVILSVPLAIAVNVLRVTGTAIIADYHTEFALGYYHAFSGWLVFVLGFACLWLVAKMVFRFSRCRS